MRKEFVCSFVLVLAGSATATADQINALNSPPRLIVQTNPAARGGEDLPLIEGPAPLSVFFSLCQSDDPDQILLPDGREDPRGDTLNWQFHFGDSGAPAFRSDGSFDPDFDHFCRVEHTYREGTYVATLSVTDKHLEDQTGRVAASARKTTQFRIRAFRGDPEPAPAAPACGTGGACLVFVSSTTSNGNLGGLAGADATCQGLAASANLPGTYKAWLSDSSSSPNSRFVHNPGPYVLVDGSTVAVDYDDLVGCACGPLVPINIDETGFLWPDTPAADVWTGTRPNGDRTDRFDGVEFPPDDVALTPNGQCGDWTQSTYTPALPHVGSVGRLSFAGALWTAAVLPRPCGMQRHLYCFQQSP